ncbi:MAG: tail fiber protein [Proteobacteria bacterium]|nr:tail fiber protein [Pseudomonadota bacterium]
MKVTTVLLSTLLSASAFASECYLGEVRSFAFHASNFELEGFVRADGQLLQIRGNEALFSLLGGRYGGDLRTTFAVPNLNSPNEKLVHFICSEGIYPSRK